MTGKKRRALSATVKTVLERYLITDANSASCVIMNQPKAPAKLKDFRKKK